MKSNNKKSTQAFGFGRLGIISLMALSLSVGRVVLAADLELWMLDGVTKFDHLSDSDSTKAVNWLVNKPDLAKFIQEFRSEPLKFAEGIKAAWTEAAKDKSKAESFRKLMTKDFENVPDFTFDKEKRTSQGALVKAGYMALIAEVFKKGNKADTADLLVSSFSAIPESAKVALNATDTKASADVGELSLAQLELLAAAACEAPKPDGKEAAFLKQIEELKNKIADLEKKNSTPAVDQALLDQVNALSAEITRAREQEAQVDPNLLANQQRQEDDLAGIFNRLLGQDEERNNNDQLAAIDPNRNNQFFPQQGNTRGDDSDLLASTPLPVPDQQGSAIPVTNSTTPGLNVPVAFDLGMNVNGKIAELTEATDQATLNSIRTKYNQNSLTDPSVAQIQLQSNMKKSQLALSGAQNKLADIDAKLSAISSDPDSFIGQAAKDELARRKADVENKRSKADNQRSIVNSFQQGDPARDAAQGQFVQMQQDLANAEAAYNTYNTSMQSARNSIAAQGKTLQAQREKLNSSISTLKGQIEEMSTEEQLAQSKIAQFQLANNQGQGTANILKAGANRGTTVSNRRPTRVGAAMGAGSVAGTKSRGSLGVK